MRIDILCSTSLSYKLGASSLPLFVTAATTTVTATEYNSECQFLVRFLRSYTSSWLSDRAHTSLTPFGSSCYALDVRQGFARTSIGLSESSSVRRFYALDAGLGFARCYYMRGTIHSMFLCPQYRAGLCDALNNERITLEVPFLCPRCRAGLCDYSYIENIGDERGYTFLCPRCRAGLCDECLPRVAVTWAFGVRCAILAGTVPPGKGFRARSAKPAADQDVSARQPRSFRAARQETVPAHVMIQKSWRSPITRAPRTTTPRAVFSSSG
jgi:hypothetical protein